MLDCDRDGKLSMPELKTLLRGQFVVACDKELHELLDNMDSDSKCVCVCVCVCVCMCVLMCVCA